jgi:biotin synthase-related radical SAM superfamily protein
MDAEPTNMHLLTHNSSGCKGNCAFCPQSQYTSNKLKNIPDSQDFLSRITWPAFDFKDVLQIIKEKYSKFGMKNPDFQRICVQTLNYQGFEQDVIQILLNLKKVTNIPISIAIPPVSVENIQNFKELGAERICFALDMATEDLFDKIKGKSNNGPYDWINHNNLLKNAVKIFGKGYVATHLIVGCGETEFEALQFIEKMSQEGIRTGVFAFTPIKNTKMEIQMQPSIVNFRKIQLGKYLIDTGKKSLSDFTFNSTRELTSFHVNTEELKKIVDLSIPFQTSGCPGCNRPYYDSKPNEEQYSYAKGLNKSEKAKVMIELTRFVHRKML